MAVVINGTDVLMFIDGARIGQTTGFTLNVDMEERPTSNKDTGKFNTSAAGRLNIDASCDAFVVYADVAIMMETYLARLPIRLHFAEDVGGSPDESKFYCEGDFIITAMNMTAQDQDNYSYTCNFKHHANFAWAGDISLRVGVLGTNCSENAVEDGFAVALPKGGTAPYTFLWDDPAPAQTTQYATALAPGTYTVVVTDSTPVTPLTATGEITITEPPA